MMPLTRKGYSYWKSSVHAEGKAIQERVINNNIYNSLHVLEGRYWPIAQLP